MALEPFDAEIAKKARPYIALLHGATGFVIGFGLGLWVWMRWNRNIRIFGDSDALNTSVGFIIVVGGITLLVTLLAACLKERFWEDWRHPFWWL